MAETSDPVREAETQRTAVEAARAAIRKIGWALVATVSLALFVASQSMSPGQPGDTDRNIKISNSSTTAMLGSAARRSLDSSTSQTRSANGAPPAASPPQGSRYDLNGEWKGIFTVGDPNNRVEERVVIQQIGDKIIATKITGDDFVPAGKVTIRGTYNSNPFYVEQVCAFRGYANPSWNRVKLTIVDETHLRLEGSCGASEVLWERIGKTTLALDNSLLFDLDKYELKPQAASVLEGIKQQLDGAHPNAHLLVAGYTDDLGTDAHNLQLSTQRARSVATWLESRGMTKSLLSVKGFGKTNPRYPNTNEEARAHNRRVEIVILE